MTETREHGVLAVGDSLTAQCGFPVGNLPLATWAQWVARALEEPITTYAGAGATSRDAVDFLPSTLGDSFRLGLVYVGTNDFLQGRPVDEYAAAARVILTRIAESASTTLTFSLPLWLNGFPAPPPYGKRRLRRLLAYGEALRDVATEAGVVVVQAPELYGHRYVAADRVHLTAAGQLAFADAAAWRLRDLGWVLPLPSVLAPERDPEPLTRRAAWMRRSVRAYAEAPLRTYVRARRLR